MVKRKARYGGRGVAVATMVAAAVSLLPAGLAARAAKPERIVSVNLCTDQMLLELAPRQRIAAVTNLATDPLSTPVPEQAAGLPDRHEARVGRREGRREFLRLLPQG